MFGFGSLLCNVFICFPIALFGLKKCMYFAPIPNVVDRMLLSIQVFTPKTSFFQINWILIYFANKSVYLHVARILLGISGGTMIVSFPIFIAEVSDNKYVILNKAVINYFKFYKVFVRQSSNDQIDIHEKTQFKCYRIIWKTMINTYLYYSYIH